jgi:hypothetical protein
VDAELDVAESHIAFVEPAPAPRDHRVRRRRFVVGALVLVVGLALLALMWNACHAA